MAEEIEFEFDVVATLPTKDASEGVIVDALFEAGCDDAVVGLGAAGLVAVGFTRTGADADTVIGEAVKQVMAALPKGSRLREVRPDLVSLAEIAAHLGVTRQALQKRELPPVSLGGLYRVTEIKSALDQRPGKLAAALKSSHGWFASAPTAQNINAIVSLDQIESRRAGSSRKTRSWSVIRDIDARLGSIPGRTLGESRRRQISAGKT